VDEAAFVREVYDASYYRLVGQLVGVTGSLAEAEDVVQEAFVR
jgi:RNA polymerase sigma-70 factor (ECF subfamily)